MPVRSLVDLASLTCIKNIRQLDSVGDYLPYDTVRHILLKVENANQLRRIELNSPQIDGRTGEIWLKLIEKDFPLEFRSKAYKPQNPSKWYKVWEKYKKDHDRSVEESELAFKNAMAGIQQDRQKNTSKIVERKLLPRKGATGPKRGHRDNSSSTLNFTGGSRTKTLTGASIMRKVRREANEIASIKGSLSRSITVPQRQGQSEIKKAPQSMLDDHRRAAQPSNAPSNAPAKKPKVPSAVTEHEERATFISESDEAEDDGDVLFDEPRQRPGSKPMAKTPAKTTLNAAMSGTARSAAASLLKTRPSGAASSRPTARTSAPKTTDGKPRPAGTSSIPGKSSVSSTARASAATSPSKAPDRLSSRSSSKLPEREGIKAAPPPSRTQTSPPLGPSAGPSSPPPAGSPPPRPPKRRAPDIFMRPKKRIQ